MILFFIHFRSKSGHFHEISELDDEKDDDVELCVSCASEVESRIKISKKYTKGKKEEKKSLHGTALLLDGGKLGLVDDKMLIGFLR